MLAHMSADPDERDWRLSGQLADGGGYLHGFLGRRKEEHAASDARAAVGSDVVVTHDGGRLFAYAASRAAIESARTKLEAALKADGIEVSLRLSTWSEEHDEWIDPEAPPPPAAVAAQEAPVTRTYVVTLGRWVREEFEQSISARAAELGVTCEVVEHPHVLSSQTAFTVSGPARKVDQLAAAMHAEEQATIRTETTVMASPL
jgi:hypothetical protein